MKNTFLALVSLSLLSTAIAAPSADVAKIKQQLEEVKASNALTEDEKKVKISKYKADIKKKESEESLLKRFNNQRLKLESVNKDIEATLADKKLTNEEMQIQAKAQHDQRVIIKEKMDKLENKLLAGGYEKTLPKDIALKETKPGAMVAAPKPAAPKIDYKPVPYVAPPKIGGWDEEEVPAKEEEDDAYVDMSPENQFGKLKPLEPKVPGKAPASTAAAKPAGEPVDQQTVVLTNADGTEEVVKLDEKKAPISAPQPKNAQTAPEDPALEACMKELKDEDMSKYMKLQGELTLNRLAWVFLDNTKIDENHKAQKIEKTIDDLLKQLSDDEYKEAKEQFADSKLSRQRLTKVMPYLVKILESQNDPKKKAYYLDSSDIKTVGVMSQYEEGNWSSSLFYKDPNKDESMMNLLKLVNSSYFYGNDGKTAVLSSQQKIDENKASLERQMDKVKKEMKDLVAQGAVSSTCTPPVEEGLPADCLVAEMPEMSIVDQTEKIISKMTADSSVNKQIDKELRYNSFWLKVRK